jgi:anti-anti-sigma factor
MIDAETVGVAGDVAVSIGPSVTGIRLSGVIDFAVERDLRSAARTALDRDLPVRVELSAVTFLDSEGLGFLAQLLRGEDRSGRSVTVVHASTLARARLELVGLDRLVTFED